MIPPDDTQRLAELLQQAGADLDLSWKNTGYPLTYEELQEARGWLSGVQPGSLEARPPSGQNLPKRLACQWCYNFSQR